MAGLTAAHVEALGGETAILDNFESATERMKPDQLRGLDWPKLVVEARVHVQKDAEATRERLFKRVWVFGKAIRG